jgi:sialate O-acetylesterase
MISKFTTRFCVLSALTFAFAAHAEVKLHGLFGDNMVLQRDAAVPVWGWADDGEKVTVEFRNQKVSTTAKDGKWMVKLKKLKAGGPDELRVNGKSTAIALKNVLVGEVWIASGQSNMEWPMRASFSPDTEIPRTENGMLRLYTVPKLKAEEPRDNVPATWQQCNPSTTPNFSAVAYYFGRDLAKALNVPVGIIHTSWGGSPAEVWMSEDVLTSNPAYKTNIFDAYSAQAARAKEAIAAFEKEQEAAKAEGKTFNKRRPGMPWRPTELYNGMIAPLIPYAIKGAIWYQGESNAGRAHQYRTLFADMIRNWRADWDQGDFPFLLVQLAPFMEIKEQPSESAWAELREAQALATKKLPKVGMAVITDVGDEKDIHPKKKEPVGARLALAAQKIAYGQDIVYSGPTYKGMKVKDGKAVLSFENVGSGLEARGGELKGFAIAGADKKFVWAKAEIQGDKVIVSSPEVSEPVAVRYGWADFPVVNLWNKDGLPASPFRTDDFQMTTFAKK